MSVADLPAPIAAVVASALDACRDAGAPGVAAGIVREGRVAWAGGRGAADPGGGAPVDGATRFRIASVTKTFTASAILALRDAGALDLDDPIERLVPEARAIRETAGTRAGLTLGRLLDHTAGLQHAAPRDAAGMRDEPRPDAILARLGRAEIVRRPGERWVYGNLGYELLAIAAERASGLPYPELLARRVLAPLGCSATGYAEPEPGDTGAATGLLADGSVAPGHDPLAHRGDGGLWSSAADLARWLAAQCRTAPTDRAGADGCVLDGATLREMHRPRTLVDAGWTLAQGYGWAMERLDGTTWIRHTGSMRGFRSIVLGLPERGLGVAILVNGSERPNAAARTIASALLAAAGPAVAPREPAGAPVAAGPAGIAGTWTEPVYGFGVRIARSTDGLSLAEGETQDWAPLLPTDDPAELRIGGDRGNAGERIRIVRAADGTAGTIVFLGHALRRRG